MPPSSLWQWAFDPQLIGGAIFNVVRNETGTIGGFARDAGGDVYLISCAHVLLSAGAAGSEPIVVGLPAGALPIADADPANADLALDFAAAAIRPGVGWKAEAVGLGPLHRAPIAPAVGMRVCKMGAETLLTEGTVDVVLPSEFIIVPSRGFPRDYELSQRGDSGALWVEIETKAPVGLHRRGGIIPHNFAAAIPLLAGLASLGVTWVASP